MNAGSWKLMLNAFEVEMNGPANLNHFITYQRWETFLFPHTCVHTVKHASVFVASLTQTHSLFCNHLFYVQLLSANSFLFLIIISFCWMFNKKVSNIRKDKQTMQAGYLTDIVRQRKDSYLVTSFFTRPKSSAELLLIPLLIIHVHSHSPEHFSRGKKPWNIPIMCVPYVPCSFLHFDPCKSIYHQLMAGYWDCYPAVITISTSVGSVWHLVDMVVEISFNVWGVWSLCVSVIIK